MNLLDERMLKPETLLEQAAGAHHAVEITSLLQTEESRIFGPVVSHTLSNTRAPITTQTWRGKKVQPCLVCSPCPKGQKRPKSNKTFSCGVVPREGCASSQS